MSRRNETIDPEVARGLAELEAALAGEPGADEALVLLASDLRAEAPRMSAAFSAELNERVEAGFPRTSLLGRLLGQQRAFLLPAMGIAASLMIAVVVIGLSGGGGGGDGADRDAVTALSEPGAAKDTQLGAPLGSGGSGGAAPNAAQTPEAAPADQAAPAPALLEARRARGTGTGKPGFGRRVERSAQLTLTTAPDDVQDVADQVVGVTQQVGGIVSSSSITTNDGSGSAQFALRIPTRRLDDALRRFSRLAHVGSLSQNANDITAPFISAADRLSDARAERKALLRALAKATTAAQIASLRARLRANRSEIAAYKGELNSLRRRANFSNVELAVEGTGRKRGDGGGTWTPKDALDDALRVLEVAAGVALIAIAALLPVALLGALGALAAGAARRRRREQALDTA